MNDGKHDWQSWHYLALWIIASISLLLNVLLFAGLFAFRARAQQEVRDVSIALEEINIGEGIEVPIVIDQSLPLSMTIPFSDTFRVPINHIVAVDTSIPFSQTIEVPIRDVIHIDTTVNIPAPFGNATLPIPIQADIPISLDVTVPISRQVPVVMEIPVRFDVEVPIQSDVPINTDVPVEMAFPVTVPLDDLGFNAILEQVKGAIELLARALGVDLDQP